MDRSKKTKTEPKADGTRDEIEIFENPSKKIDIGTLLESRLLICANSGGGKSYAVRKILEKSHKKILPVVLDIEGEFQSLKEKFNFLLIGGPNGDVPLDIKTAGSLPKKILERNIPTIIDISELKKEARIKFVKEFLDGLMELDKKYWKPLLIFLDEAHQFAGQHGKEDSVWAVIDLMTRGRKRGYCGILCTQRIAKLHKDAAAEANNIMVGRTLLDIDAKRAADMLGFSKRRQRRALHSLEPGEFMCSGPAFSFKGVEKQKVAKVATTHIQKKPLVSELDIPDAAAIAAAWDKRKLRA